MLTLVLAASFLAVAETVVYYDGTSSEVATRSVRRTLDVSSTTPRRIEDTLGEIMVIGGKSEMCSAQEVRATLAKPETRAALISHAPPGPLIGLLAAVDAPQDVDPHLLSAELRDLREVALAGIARHGGPDGARPLLDLAIALIPCAREQSFHGWSASEFYYLRGVVIQRTSAVLKTPAVGAAHDFTAALSLDPTLEWDDINFPDRERAGFAMFDAARPVGEVAVTVLAAPDLEPLIDGRRIENGRWTGVTGRHLVQYHVAADGPGSDYRTFFLDLTANADATVYIGYRPPNSDPPSVEALVFSKDPQVQRASARLLAAASPDDTIVAWHGHSLATLAGTPATWHERPVALASKPVGVVVTTGGALTTLAGIGGLIGVEALRQGFIADGDAATSMEGWQEARQRYLDASGWVAPIAIGAGIGAATLGLGITITVGHAEGR